MSKTTVLNEVKTVVQTVIAGVYIYPDQMASTPNNIEPIAIIQEARGVQNRSNYVASKCINHSWQVEVLVIVGRGEVKYPSIESAAFDTLANNIELSLTGALLEADFSDSINNSEVLSDIGWYQWEKVQKKHEGIYAVRFLLPVSGIIEL